MFRLNIFLTLNFFCQYAVGAFNFSTNYDKIMNSSKSLSSCESTAIPKTAETHALIPYTNNAILSQFYETSKTFAIPQVKKNITILQDWRNHGVAGVVWEAALVLSEFIAQSIPMKNKKVLELGAGTGLVGMTSLALGGTVTFTDIGKALPLLQQNIDENFPHKNTTLMYAVKELEWGKNLEYFSKCAYDYIFGADIIYREDTFDALVNTLAYLTCLDQSERVTKIILSSKLRYNRVEVFLSKLKTRFASVHKIHEELSSNVVIYECF